MDVPVGLKHDRSDPSTAPVIVITGIMAAGKSSVAEALARRLPAAAHVRGDAFRRMIVSGQAEMSPPLSESARRQLRLRQELTVSAAEGYAAAGITAVMQDLYLGEDLTSVLGMIGHRPLYLVVLAPEPQAVAEREERREKSGYIGWTVAEFDAELRRSARVGLWLDSTALTVDQTVDAILDQLESAAIE